MLKFLAVVLLVIFLLIVLFFSPLFKIKTIEFTQNQNCLSQENLNSQFLGKIIFLVSPSNLENKLRSQYSCIKNLQIKKSFPHKLLIEIETDKPVVKIEGSNLYLTEGGLVIQGPSSGQLPVLYLGQNSKPNLGQKVTDQTTISLLTLASQLAKSDFVVSSIRIIDPQTIAVYNPKDTVAIFSTQREITKQVDSLQQVISKAKIDAAKIAKIDLRFDKPVITNK